jgi:hydrogenase maturation protein HypF
MPLHQILMASVGRPLVMTSANLSEEPLAYRNDEALARLGGIADLFLMHDRDIEACCDDSVARVIAGRPVVLRRARGYVPRPIALPTGFHAPVLACGALLKSTFCIGLGQAAYLGPHIGDLENLETYQFFEESIARMERFLRVVPEVVAHDLHPEYLSTTFARARSACTRIAVQHHHAHIVSAMAEHGLTGPVLGVAYDGTGYGTDGTAWGGEVMVTRYDGFERIATLRGIRLAGGDAAIRHPWRIALALVEDAFDGRAPLDSLPFFSTIPRRDLAVVRQMVATECRAPTAHGAGRYFDGIGSLVLGRPDARYEGQIAMEWNGVAEPSEERRYRYEIDRRLSPWTIDLRPMVREVVTDLRAGVPAPVISARFHNTLVAATAEVVRAAARPGAARRWRDCARTGARRRRDHEACGPGDAHSSEGAPAMCLGVPGKVIDVNGLRATVDFWGVRKEIRLEVVDEPVQPGDYILNHVGYAIRRIPAEDIEATLALYEELLTRADEDDLMAADVRGEIAGAADAD